MMLSDIKTTSLLIAVLSVVYLSGCMPEYSAPNGTPTAALAITAHPKAESTEVYLFHVKPSYKNNPNSGTMGQKIIAHISESSATKKIRAGENFRILVRQIKMHGVLASVCDTVISFRPHNGASYAIAAYSDMDSTQPNRCSAKIYQTIQGRRTVLRPNEYATVSN